MDPTNMPPALARSTKSPIPFEVSLLFRATDDNHCHACPWPEPWNFGYEQSQQMFVSQKCDTIKYLMRNTPTNVNKFVLFSPGQRTPQFNGSGSRRQQKTCWPGTIAVAIAILGPALSRFISLALKICFNFKTWSFDQNERFG